ncbi:MAG: NADH-quinone oxidoreductase subunit NuoF [Acidobacteriota bacterium]|jgi:NADH-quinone oxidoreductase subunit F
MAEERPLTRNVRPDGEPVGLDEYVRRGGYRGARTALKMNPEDVQERIKASKLRGRGGAGFPTAMKWSFVPMGDDAPRRKYLVANADEMEPGTFKDRFLMERDPHQLIEGILCTAHALQAGVAYIFLRGEYFGAARCLRRALAEARDANLLGRDIEGSGTDLEVHLHISVGRYMCGEETGLLNALEGKRANPRAKPPYPQTVGLWGKPTIVQNVETLCNVPHILANGPDWFRGLSRTDDAGTKLYGISGKVKRPGLWELPMGTPLREILEDHAGGMRDGVQFRGALPGGASTDFVTAEHLDAPMDFDGMEAAGSRLGTGTAIVLDDGTCPVGMCRVLESFFARESCGWCTPCWSGTSWAERVLTALEEGEGREEDLDKLESIVRLNAPGNTFCAFAPGAVAPLGSAIRHFREDFRRHVSAGACPWS